jgi:hypothetical protein
MKSQRAPTVIDVLAHLREDEAQRILPQFWRYYQIFGVGLFLIALSLLGAACFWPQGIVPWLFLLLLGVCGAVICFYFDGKAKQTLCGALYCIEHGFKPHDLRGGFPRLRDLL